MTDSERKILAKLDTLEEAMKMLLVNDILKDAENLTGQNQVSVRWHELQSKIDELQKLLKTKEDEISKLQSQIEAQKSRIKTLQELSDSKDRTIQTKEERIQIFQKTVQDLQNQLKNQKSGIETLQKNAENINSQNFNISIGQCVKINPSCKSCYGSPYGNAMSITDVIGGVYSKVFIVTGFATSKCELCFRFANGNSIKFWVYSSMVIPV